LTDSTEIIDISNENDPREIGSYSFVDGNATRDVIINGSYAYVANKNDLVIINISDPYNPAKIGGWFTEYRDIQGLTINGSYIYMNLGYDGLGIIDVSDPYNPVKIGQTTSEFGFTVRSAVQNNHVYMASPMGSFAILEVSDMTPSVALNNTYNTSTHQSGNIIELNTTNNQGIQKIDYNWDGQANITLTSPYNVSVPSEDGSHALNLYVENIFGYQDRIIYTFTTDDNGPVIHLVSPLNSSAQQPGTVISKPLPSAT